MKLLNTYEDHDDAKHAEGLLRGQKRLASERDDTSTIYNLFGIPSWKNFHALKMYNLEELQNLLQERSTWGEPQQRKHKEIIEALSIISKNYELAIPPHWL